MRLKAETNTIEIFTISPLQLKETGSTEDPVDTSTANIFDDDRGEELHQIQDAVVNAGRLVYWHFN